MDDLPINPETQQVSNNLNCKNCSTSLPNDTYFCNICGGKVIVQRITLKGLAEDFSNNVLGLDNRFFFTLKKLIISPHLVFQEYLNGTRKRYMNPFAILGLTTAIAIFLFNFFADEYLALNVESNQQSVSMMANMMEKQLGENFDREAYEKENLELITNASSFMLKYFNLLVILFMPIYTYMAFLVYRKPYNYAEHLIINSYIQSISFIVTSIVFTVSVFTDPSVYLLTIFFLIFYYTYAYGKLYHLSVAESILKLLIFIGTLIISIIAIAVLSFALGVTIKYLSTK